MPLAKIKSLFSNLLTALCLFCVYTLNAQQPAFPGAEGAGMYATGGRGTASVPTTVFEVTNLSDDGQPGSLRYALTAPATYRTVVFRVSGTIHLNSRLSIKANTTIAGQTAPGDGICVADHQVSIGGDNVIIRYMRFRLGDRYQKKTDANGNPVDGSGGDDALTGTGFSNIIVDHVTASWSTDEALSIRSGDNLTIQWCMISEPLNYSYHWETGDTDWEHHGFGGIWGAKRGSMHHNLFTHCKNRTPRFAGVGVYSPAVQGAEKVDFRNNVIYNWGINNIYGGEGGYYNVVNNYLKPGPSTTSRTTQIVSVDSGSGYPYAKYYLTGNYITSSSANSNNNWSGVTMKSGKLSDTVYSKVDTPFDLGYPVTTQSALEAYESVLQGAGCSLPDRDTLDQRIVNDVRNGTGRIIDVQGGYPHGTDYSQTVNAWPTLNSTTPPADTDHDGMPDSWENSNGLNPNDASDRNGVASNGYTNLENYLNSLTNLAASTNPTIYANASFNSFNQTIGTPSPAQSFLIAGKNLSSDITVTAPANYQLSIDSIIWSGSLILSTNNGWVSSTRINVRLNALANGSYSGDIVASSQGAATVNMAVNGTTSAPTLPIPQVGQAQEKLLYSTNFQEWTGFTSATEVTVTKKTDYSNEDLVFKFFQVTVDPAGENTTRFNYNVVSKGWAQAQKVVGSYIETSPLKSITKVQFIQGATGTNRGYKLWKKGLLDLIWIPIYTTPCATPAGEVVTVNINESNVALRFTNLDDTQNAYMFDLKIYGNYVSNKPQHTLTVTPNIPEAGSVTKTPNDDTYDEGMTVKLQANRNFGYRFIKWIDSLGTVLSTANPYNVTMDADKKIIAVFDTVATYALNVNIAGSKWGEVQLTPQPVNGKYETGTVVTIKVIPNAVTNFSHWEDNSTTLQRVITVDGNKNFTATFDEVSFIVGWNFKASTPLVSRTGDFYSQTTNIGMISAYDPNGSSVSWKANSGAFSPSYPNVHFNTPAAEFKTKRRYLQADFSTLNYKNIQVTSMVGAASQAYAVQVLQYSLDNVNFTELARVDITSVYNAGWKTLSATLPANAEGQKRVYIRWIADNTSPILGDPNSIDGTSFTNVFVFADKYMPVDTVAPVLIATEPANGSKTASINGTVVLTFNETMKAGTGNIMLGSTVLSGTFGSRAVSFNYQKLSYNTPYTFTVPAGALTDLAGNPFPGITVTFNTSARTQPAKKLFDAVVAQDGTGDYPSVLLAIAAAPTNRTAPWLIYIKNGKYTGHIDIPSNKPFIHLIGQDRDSVIISDNRLSGEDGSQTTPTFPVQLGATVYVNAPDCHFENLIIENSFGYEKQAGPQALALYTEADRFTANNCWLRSYQDTYLTAYGGTQYRHYWRNSKIEGAVDFIYGGGDVLFDKCTITCTRKDGGYIVAPSHATGTAWGYVFSHCTIDEAHASGVTTYFGRPWHNAPKTVFLYTTLKAKVYPKGWYYKMGAIPAVFADYATMDANGNMVDTSYRIEDYEYNKTDSSGNTITIKGKAKKSLTDAEAATYTYENVLIRKGSNWDPRMMTDAPEKPAKVLVKGSTLSWKDVPYSRLYIVFRNGKVLDFTTSNTYTDSSAENNTAYTYAVQTVSEYGALSEMTNAVDDTTLPVVIVKNITVALDTLGRAAITADMVDNGSHDESGIDTLYLDKSSFDCSNIGGNQVTLTVKDKRGNVSSATAVVTVKDDIAPIVLTKNIELTLTNGSAVLKPSDIDAGSGDACGISTMNVSRTSFECSSIGNHSVVLTVTDKNGNSSSASAIVTIKGVIPTPAIAVSRKDTTYTGAGASTILLGYGAQSLTLTATDGSSTGATNFSWSPAAGLSSTTTANPEFTPANAGTYTLQVTAVNNYGCSASAAVTINVVEARCGDMMDKVFVCHQGQPICIGTTDVKQHLAHGCKVGTCGSQIASLVANDKLEASIGAEQKSIQVYPIPASDLLNVQFTLRKGVQYRLELYDLRGVLVQSLDKGYAADNTVYTHAFDVSRLSAGIYVLRVTTNSEIITKKVVIQ